MIPWIFGILVNAFPGRALGPLCTWPQITPLLVAGKLVSVRLPGGSTHKNSVSSLSEERIQSALKFKKKKSLNGATIGKDWSEWPQNEFILKEFKQYVKLGTHRSIFRNLNFFLHLMSDYQTSEKGFSPLFYSVTSCSWRRLHWTHWQPGCGQRVLRKWVCTRKLKFSVGSEQRDNCKAAFTT